MYELETRKQCTIIRLKTSRVELYSGNIYANLLEYVINWSAQQTIIVHYHGRHDLIITPLYPWNELGHRNQID